MTTQQAFGLAGRRLRRDAGYSQEGFAAAVGVHRTYQGLIERGRVAATITTSSARRRHSGSR
jgi:DNA-binding XRE family transcriptional regulator